MIDHHHTSGLCTKSDREISKDSATLVVAMSPGRLDWTWPILARTSWCHSQTSGEISSKSIPHNPPANHSLPLGFVGSIVIFPYLISTFFFCWSNHQQCEIRHHRVPSSQQRESSGYLDPSGEGQVSRSEWGNLAVGEFFFGEKNYTPIGSWKLGSMILFLKGSLGKLCYLCYWREWDEYTLKYCKPLCPISHGFARNGLHGELQRFGNVWSLSWIKARWIYLDPFFWMTIANQNRVNWSVVPRHIGASP